MPATVIQMPLPPAPIEQVRIYSEPIRELIGSVLPLPGFHLEHFEDPVEGSALLELHARRTLMLAVAVVLVEDEPVTFLRWGADSEVRTFECCCFDEAMSQIEGGLLMCRSVATGILTPRKRRGPHRAS